MFDKNSVEELGETIMRTIRPNRFCCLVISNDMKGSVEAQESDLFVFSNLGFPPAVMAAWLREQADTIEATCEGSGVRALKDTH